VTLTDETRDALDTAPGVIGETQLDIWAGVRSYGIGLALSAVLTAASFYFIRSPYLWPPSIPVALAVLAVAQIGVQLVFFVHLTSAPDNVNNTLALAFGTLVVGLLIVGSLWIMLHFNHDLGSMSTASIHQSTFEGIVEPASSASLQSPVEGVIETTSCALGSRVEQGEVCARLDRAPFEQEARQAEAALAAAQAELKRGGARLVASDARRSRRNVVGKDDARVAFAKAVLAATRAKLANLDIVAPVAGIVAARNVEPGQGVFPGQKLPLFVIDARRDSVNITASVGVDAVSAIKVGAAVIATTASLGAQRFSGVVVSISADLPRADRVEIRASLADPRHALKPGASVSLTPRMP